MSQEARRRNLIPWKWSCRQVWAIICILGTKSGPSERTRGSLHGWSISQIQRVFILRQKVLLLIKIVRTKIKLNLKWSLSSCLFTILVLETEAWYLKFEACALPLNYTPSLGELLCNAECWGHTCMCVHIRLWQLINGLISLLDSLEKL